MEANQMQKRPPVVVVMGHVDHGKTTLLDYIRKANVAAKEAGGITQAVGAYEIVHTSNSSNGPTATRITFIDTPGHAAFTKMRSRGANIADIAILVIAADDGVNVQTKEAIQIIQAAKIPYVVAINKIDKNNADAERSRADLMKAGVILEGYGGSVSYQEISAKTGQGVEELLELIALTAEVENLTYNPNQPAQGLILEAHTDKRSGNSVTAIIKNGTLRVGDEIAAGQVSGKIKGLKNFAGESLKELIPSSPAVILGFETLPNIGDEFFTNELIKEVAVIANKIQDRKADTDISKKLSFVIKANVAGSLEALVDAIGNLKSPDGTFINIASTGVGEVTDGDAKTALSTNAFIVAFKVSTNSAAKTLITAHNLKVFESEIIYELLESIEDVLLGRQRQILAGELDILAVFSQKSLETQVVGGKVITGEIKNHIPFEIVRRGAKIGDGKITNLQQGKKDAQLVPTGLECGMLVSADKMIATGDHLIQRMQ